MFDLDRIRTALYVAVAVMAFFIFSLWSQEHVAVDQHTPDRPAAAAASTIPAASPASVVSSAPAISNSQADAVTRPKSAIIHIKTDVLSLAVDTLGGDIVSTSLLSYPESLSNAKPFVLLNDDPKTRYVAQSGLLSEQGPDNVASAALYQAEKTDYQLATERDELTVPLTWVNSQGLKVTKIFTFKKGSYQIRVSYDIDNTRTSQAWTGQWYAQLSRTDSSPEQEQGLSSIGTFFGAAVSSKDKAFEKITFKDMHDRTLWKASDRGWAAMVQHYFVSAWIPPQNSAFHLYSKVNDKRDMYSIGLIGDSLRVDAGKRQQITYTLYSGPMVEKWLDQTAPKLDLAIDYGIFSMIASPLFWLLEKIYNVVGNWGWSIILITLFIKIIFYPLSAKSYRSMSLMKKVQPKIEAIREQYKDDRTKLTQAMMQVYQQEKIHPLGGCLPILLQIPVFISLYWMLVESIELRQAPFMLWIHDLSQKDPYYVLPVLMAISMFIQQKLSPPPADPTQAKVLMLMPLVFGVLFVNFPSGLMLYWVVNNTLSFLQQWYVMRKFKS